MQAAESPTPETVLAIVSRVHSTVTDRLSKHRRHRNLFTYDGTLLDQLALHFIRSCWHSGEYTILASTRPCMSPALQTSVSAFTARHSLPLISHTADCVVDEARSRFVSVQCDNVSPSIVNYLGQSGGLLVIGSLLSDWSRSRFLDLESKLQSYEATSYPELKRQRNWYTLFLFDGFFGFDILVAYCYYISHSFESCLMPSCYLSCHNEDQLDRMRHLITTKADAIRDAVLRAQLRVGGLGVIGP